MGGFPGTLRIGGRPRRAERESTDQLGSQESEEDEVTWMLDDVGVSWGGVDVVSEDVGCEEV